MSSLLGFLLRVLSAPVVDRALDYLERRAATKVDADRVRAEVEIEAIREAARVAATMASVETARYAHGWYWLFAGAFVLPLAAWWVAVILDSIFLFPWSVAALPPPLDDWAAMMIGWLFLAGGFRAMVGGRR